MARERVAVALLLAALLGGCRTAPVHDVANARLESPTALTLDEVHTRIARAARTQGWVVEDVEPGVVIVSKTVDDHVATSTITFDTNQFSISLRHSVNLRQHDGSIHKVYNQWVEALELGIRQEAKSPY